MERRRIILRKSTDLNLIKALHVICFPYDEFEEKPNTIWWVGFHDEQPVCFAGLTVYNNGRDQCGYLIRGGVQPSYRGQNLQMRLIKTREKEAKKLGLKELVTYTVLDNLPSSNNLIKCGFRLYSPSEQWGGDANYWLKKIKKKKPG